jgi:hypothetical protein
MSYSKAHLFTDADQQAARISKAISHPARIAILRIMAQKEYVESRTLIRMLPLAAPTVQQHLNFLSSREIIGINTKPAKARYWINWQRFEGLRSMLNQSLDQVSLIATEQFKE